jgi:hypothetical protein
MLQKRVLFTLHFHLLYDTLNALNTSSKRAIELTVKFFEKNLIIYTSLTVDEAMNRLETLFKEENLIVERNKKQITSVLIPVPLVTALDRRMYSQKNKMGINPFVFLSSIFVSFEVKGENQCVATLMINYERTVLWLLFFIFVPSYMIGIFPFPVGLFSYLAVVLLAYMFLFKLIIGYLIRYEITAALNVGRGLKNNAE